MTQEVFIIHHTDPDGFCSGAIVKTKHPKAHLLPFYYEANFHHLSRIPDGSLIYIVDASLPNHVMKELMGRADVVWIDHHDTAIKKAEEDPIVNACKGIRVIGTAACELTWKYLYKDQPMPRAVSLIGAFDVKNKKHWPDAPIFNTYLYGNDYRLSEATMNEWLILLDMDDDKSVPYEKMLDMIIGKWKVAYDYSRHNDSISARAITYKATIKGHLCLVANRSQIGSEYFESMVTPDIKLLVSMHITKRGMIKYTIFSATEDGSIHIGNLCEELSNGRQNWVGGGHVNVGGLTCNKILLPRTEFTQL